MADGADRAYVAGLSLLARRELADELLMNEARNEVVFVKYLD